MEFDFTLNNPGIRTLVNQSRHRDRILRILNGDLPKRPLTDSNCHGLSLYLLNDLDLPSFVEPEEMYKIMSKNYRVIGGKDDIIAVWANSNGFLYHTGIYLGDISERKVVFEKNGIEGEYQFSDFSYFQQGFYMMLGKRLAFETEFTVLLHGKSR
jgi:hypothetical protein